MLAPYSWDGEEVGYVVGGWSGQKLSEEEVFGYLNLT